VHAFDVDSGIELLSGADVVVSDMYLPDGSWVRLLDHASSTGISPPVIVATKTLESRLWAEALWRGAYDVLAKPFNTKEVLYVVQNAWLMQLRRKTGQHPAGGNVRTVSGSEKSGKARVLSVTSGG
jgi:DNA-binding NtrC family response regulator